MELKGSCHCEKVSFKVLSHTPSPCMKCYCSICRKCQGGGGYAMNIMGQYDTLEILTGKEYLKGYQAMKDKDKKELGGNIRYFCTECGSHLYAYDKQFGEFVYPFASAIDTPLPEVEPATEVYHIMLNSKANWVTAPKPGTEGVHVYEEYPDCSLEQWHKQRNKFID
ncbi:Mss4-like protein [Helicostylum pulchrum]|uniref:CENP-V/GFA domain-containing protein n=1 Tax=Helicostylum pulchrum TaxID=562976 RepID=A0ABP9XM90_9FUNG|nr:Mss4-like protein [Helicostylum pulchrum]